MISNERPSPYDRFNKTKPREKFKQKERVPETTIAEESLQVERKKIHIKLQENRGGRFLRIIEADTRFYNTVIIPAIGLEEFQKCLAAVIQASEKGLGR